ncbi:MAG: hypothetical protein IPP53_15285 [Bacteroidetes bacterium]|nr:hypothetical protein [Bacteroidota bacterium]
MLRVETRKLSDTEKGNNKGLSFQIEQNIDIIVSENQEDLVKMPDADPKDRLMLNKSLDGCCTKLKRFVALLDDQQVNLLYTYCRKWLK